jgi:hypothetical protein
MFPKKNMSKAIVGGICAFIYSLERPGQHRQDLAFNAVSFLLQKEE